MRWIAAATIFLLAVTGCVPPPGLKTADDLMIQQDYLGAVKTYEEVLLEVQDDTTRKQVEEKIAAAKIALVDAYLMQAEEQYRAMTTPNIPALNRIVSELQSVERWDDAEGRLKGGIARYKKETRELLIQVQGYLKAASEAARRYDFSTALEMVEAAAAIDSGNTDVRSAKAQVAEQQALYGEVQSRIAQQDLDGVIAAFKNLAATYEPQPTLVDSPFAGDIIGMVKKEAEIKMAENRWIEALNYLKQWQSKELAPLMRAATRGAADHLFVIAQSELAQGRAGKAYLYSTRAATLDPRNMEIFQLNKKARDLVNKQIQSYIAIASFDTPSDDPDAGKQFSDSLISFLYQELPYGVNILEREKIDYALREQSAETSTASDMLGVDLVVTGSVSLFKVESNTDTRKATVKVAGNEEMVVNPAFTQMHQLYGPDTSRWPEVPEKTIKKVQMERIQYTKGTGRKEGFAKVSVRIFDADKGTISFVKDYNANVSKVSEFQDEVAEAGIEYIPMSLPSDTELKEEMRRGIIQELAAVVQASFERRELRFFNQVQFYLDRLETNEAMESLAAGYLYCLQDGIGEDNPEFVQFKLMIEEFVR